MLAADDKQLGAGEHAGKEVIPGGALAAEFLRRIDRRIDHTGETRLRLPQRLRQLGEARAPDDQKHGSPGQSLDHLDAQHDA